MNKQQLENYIFGGENIDVKDFDEMDVEEIEITGDVEFVEGA